eukprot:4568212-Alexandrium_andersonii.AAC.1
MGLRSQQAPQGEMSLPRAWNRRKTGIPDISALRSVGAALRPELQLKGSPFSAESKPCARTFRP